MTGRELAIAAPLVFLAILFGVYPQALFNYITPTVNRQVRDAGRLDPRGAPGLPGDAGDADGRRRP